ncbi:MAG: hypothetical protein GY798_07490 [Hyphomicrobiales bacterium]|nr:hypothetical protein [Hyphomicrobiales bacterium]
MRLIVFFCYGLILLIGTIIIVGRGPSHELVATRDLAGNHRLQTGEVVLKVDDGRYILRSIKADEIVKQADIAATPDASLPKDHVPIPIKVSGTKVDNGVIDAGTKGLICPPEVAVNIVAVFCGMEAASCVAITAVPADKSGDVTDAYAELSLSTGENCE